MGCFSFICKKSNEAVLSTSFSGDAVHLFLLKDGKVMEHMFGNYDSYGRVFKKELRTDVQHELHDSFKWKMGWSGACDLMFDKDKNNGICAILAPYWKEGDDYPTERSEGDPNQGWGEHGELLGDTSNDLSEWVDEPYHKILNIA